MWGKWGPQQCMLIICLSAGRATARAELFFKREALASLSFLLRLLNQIWERPQEQEKRRRKKKVRSGDFPSVLGKICGDFRFPCTHLCLCCLSVPTFVLFIRVLISSRTGLWVTADYDSRLRWDFSPGAAIAVPQSGDYGSLSNLVLLDVDCRAEKRIISVCRLFLSRQLHFQWCFWPLRASD